MGGNARGGGDFFGLLQTAVGERASLTKVFKEFSTEVLAKNCFLISLLEIGSIIKMEQTVR